MIDDTHVCLIRNYRVAVGKTLVELPAGTLEPGEDPAVTAGRELVEETGLSRRVDSQIARIHHVARHSQRATCISISPKIHLPARRRWSPAKLSKR